MNEEPTDQDAKPEHATPTIETWSFLASGQSRRFLAEMGEIARSPASIEQRGAALLEPLQRLVRYDTGWIGLRDDETGHHQPLATVGPTDALEAYFSTTEADEELERVGLHKFGPPIRTRDLPMPMEDTLAWGEYLLPAGFREGLGVALFTGDGRLLGHLILLSEDRSTVTDRTRALLHMVNSVMTAAIDRMPTVTAAATLVPNAVGAAVLTRGGAVLPLPGLPDHPLLTQGSHLLQTASAHTAANGTSSFMCPWDGTGAQDGYLGVTAIDCRRQNPSDHLMAALILHPPPDLLGLAPLDLAVLGYLLDGWFEPAIADARGIRLSLLRDRLERICTQLEAPTLIIAMLRASRKGLYIPPALLRDEDPASKHHDHRGRTQGS